MTLPVTRRAKVIASIAATLDASDLGGTDGAWPAYADGNESDPNYPELWVEWKLDLAAAEVAKAVLEADGHPDRSAFLTLQGPFTSGQVLPSYTGDIGSVLVAPTGSTYALAFERSAQQVGWRRKNWAIVGTVGDEYYYVTDDNLLFFSGDLTTSRARVYLGGYDPATFDFQTYPLDLLNAVEANALAHLFPQGGHKLEAASHFQREWEAVAAMLAGKDAPRRPNPYVKESA